MQTQLKDSFYFSFEDEESRDGGGEVKEKTNFHVKLSFHICDAECLN